MPEMPETLAPLVDLDRLRTHLEAHLPSFRGAIGFVSQATHGSSNITLVLDIDGRPTVLRRPPGGSVAESSHDVSREYRFISALYGTGVPVPEPVLLCSDPGILGSPFYLMGYVDGLPLQAGIPEPLDVPGQRRRICEQAVRTLAVLHTVDWRDRDIPGRPSGYIDRQLKRWQGQLDGYEPDPRREGLRELGSWVRNNAPAEHETTVIHGDFGLHNMLISKTAPAEVLAVVDWELAALGDPLADIVWFLNGWGETPTRNPANEIATMEGAMTAAEMLSLYSEITGRTITNLRFYRVFSAWKGIAIWEGLYQAHLAGHAANANVATFGDSIPGMIGRALAIARGDDD